ncbi:MAG TPA: DUF748 domain-containing protein [Candidatus Limnocylindria bacterium]|nr:DUF748 domain-containing protein [Candidatus Limnocylindria bacterium]
MRRRVLLIAALLAVLGIGLLVGFRAALGLLRGEIVAALGPGAQVGSIDVGVRRLAVNEVVLPGGPRWPAEAALRTERVAIAPSLLSLLTPRIHIASVEVVRPYVAMVRTRRGKLRVVPTLLEEPVREGRAPDDAPAPPRPRRQKEASPREAGTTRDADERAVTVRRITIENGEVDFYDGSVAQPPWRLRLVGVEATVESVTAPEPSGPSGLDVRATLDGPSRDGTITLTGWVDPGTKDLELHARLRGVDLLAFQPYVARSTSARLAGGAFDLDLDATVREGRLTAPGRLVLSDVAVAPGRRGSERVLGVPRELLLAALAAKGNRIEVAFTLAGDLNDPRFSLNEAVATRIVAALLESLGGLSIPGLVEGVGELGGTGLKGTGEVVKGVGDALKGLLRRR